MPNNIPQAISEHSPYLSGFFLIATPAIGDPRFHRSVIYICAHDENGAMGLVINKRFQQLELKQILESIDSQKNFNLPDHIEKSDVLCGGPVDLFRGFMIHSADFTHESSIAVQDTISVTGTIDGLLSMTTQNQPRHSLFMLGHAEWMAGQLENELKENAWLTVKATEDILFHSRRSPIWDLALQEIGITANQLSALSGQA